MSEVRVAVEQATARTLAARERYQLLLAATRLVMAQADVILSVGGQPGRVDPSGPRDRSERPEVDNRGGDIGVVRES